MKFPLIIWIAVIFTTSESVGDNCDNTEYWASFGYQRKCATGRSQSPININEYATITGSGCDIRFYGYGKAQNFKIKNNGHTVVLTPLDESNPAYMMAVPSRTKYKFAQFHFHWGASDRCGSEHTVNGYPSPLELHIVHYDPRYGDSLQDVIKKNIPDSLAVLSVRLHIDPQARNGFHAFIQHFKNIRGEGQEEDSDESSKEYTEKENNEGLETVSDPFQLKRLLPFDECPYFFYRGSLTTPGCNEIVMWTVLKNTVGIKDSQLEKFRHFRGEVTPLVDNFRSPQPLNGRQVFQYIR